MDEVKKAPDQSRGPLILGLILVLVGIAVAIAQFTTIGGSFIVALLGVAFLIAAGVTRQYGFVVPGCILTGLGIGIVAQDVLVDEPGWPVVVGLGLGFIGIWVVDEIFTRAVPRSGRWWPLIPGGILLTVGVLDSMGANAEPYTPYIGAAALIVIGVLVIVRAMTGGKGSHTT
jgi:hypothetical protein